MYTDQGLVIGDYQLIRGIGQGNFSKVYEARKKQSKQHYAVKVIDKKKVPEFNGSKNNFKSQIDVMKNANSDFVIKLFQSIEKDEKLYLIMQLCDQGNLESYLQQRKILEQSQAITIFKQILCGVLSLHAINVTHRDLKPENILLKGGRYKIGDLGFARFLIFLDQTINTVLGTPDYMAPQIMKGHPYTRKSDIWSLGVILYKMVCGKLPYDYQTSARKYMIQTLENKQVIYPQNLSQAMKLLIKSCLKIDPNQRINWLSLMQHPILRSDSYNKNIEEILKKYQFIEELVKQYEEYSKKINHEKLKLHVLSNIVKFKQQKINQQFERSRRLLELRLLITSQCIINCQYFLKIYDNENKSKPPQNLLSFQHFDQYKQSYQYKLIRDEFKQLYRKFNNCYNDASNKLFLIQDKITHRIKDKLKQIFSSKKSKEKERMLQGIPNIDYQEQEHINFTIEFIKDPEIGIIQKLLNKITPCAQLYEFVVLLSLYRRMIIKFDEHNEEIEKIIKEMKKKVSNNNNMQQWRYLIERQLNNIQ